MNKLMYLLLIVMILILNIIIRSILGRGYSIVKLHNFVWLSAYLIYFLNPYKFYDLDYRVLLFSFVYILVFNFSFILSKKMKTLKKINNFQIQTEIKEHYGRVKILIIISIIFWLISYSRLINALTIINTYGIGALRSFVYYSDIYTTIEKLAYQYFVQPVFILSIVIASEMLVFSKDRLRKLVVVLIALVNASVYSLLFGGRALFLILLIYIIYLLLINNSGNLLSIIKKQKKIVLTFLILMIGIGIFASMRVNRQWGILGEFGLYVFGSLGFLSKLLENNMIQPFSLFGRGYLGGIYDTFGLALRVFGIDIQLTSQVYANSVTGFIEIGEGVTTNFTATSLATFYMEGGLVGIIIGAILFAYICAKIEDRFIGNNSLLNLSLYLYFTNIAFESIQNYTLKSVVVIFVISYMYIFFNNKRRVKHYDKVILKGK